MKSILIVSAVFPPEPVVSAKLSYDLSEALSTSNKVMIVAPKPSRPYGFKFNGQPGLSNNSQLFYLNSFVCPESKMIGRLRETYSFGRKTFKFIEKYHQSIDRIYSNTWPLFAQYLTVKASRKFNIPVTIHVQDIYPEALASKVPFLSKLINYILMPIDRYVFKHADHVIAISEKMKSYLAETRQVPSSKISVVLNWQDESDFDQFNSKHEEKRSGKLPFTFMYLGNIGPVAGLDLVIDAFATANIKDSKLVIAGSGSVKNELQEQSKVYPNLNIEFWDVPDGKVPEIQHLADIMLLPMKEGAASSSIPSKLPAYMFSKRPVLACIDQNSDSANAITLSGCGWHISAGDLNGLSQKMFEISSMNKEILARMGEKGYNYAVENFSKKNNLNKLIAIIYK